MQHEMTTSSGVGMKGLHSRRIADATTHYHFVSTAELVCPILKSETNECFDSSYMSRSALGPHVFKEVVSSSDGVIGKWYQS
jgi:hypothetical protein